MFQKLRRDAARYVALGGWYRNLGFWVGATYRLGFWARSSRSGLVRLPMGAIHRLINLPWRVFLNVQISPAARIGPGLCLIHPSNILIPPTDIGEDCLIFHDVTIGTNPIPPGYPKIGDKVDIYVGARVLGGIVVGDGAKIGANCVVNHSVAAGSVVVLAPNRVVPPALVAAFGVRARPAESAETAPDAIVGASETAKK